MKFFFKEHKILEINGYFWILVPQVHFDNLRFEPIILTGCAKLATK